MLATLTRQDLQGVVDVAKNRIIERLVSRAEFQNVSDFNREKILTALQNYHQQQQRLIAQSTWQINQALQRTIQMEARLVSLEQQIKLTQQLLQKVLQGQADLPKALAPPAIEPQPQVSAQASYTPLPAA